MDNRAFVDNLSYLLDSRGMSYARAAEKIGTVTAPTLCRYISGQRNPELSIACDIAKAFDVSLDWLVGMDRAVEKGVLSPEQKALLDAYAIATPDDRKIVDTVLEKYKK